MTSLPPHLQRLTDGLPEDKRPYIEEAIATAPYLQERMTRAIEAGRLEHIRLTPSGVNEGGHGAFAPGTTRSFTVAHR